MNTRRNFIKSATACAAATTFQQVEMMRGFQGTICLFSKHLPGMDYTRLAKTVKALGFDGVDLTVRPGGHVLPERAAEDLPKAAAAIRKAGLSLPMITTGLISAADPTAKPILSSAAKLAIPFFKPGYYKYSFVDVRSELDKAMKELRGLAELSKQMGVRLGFHNHEGNIGGQFWDVSRYIDQLDAAWAGYYFDIRHAVCEGGSGGWKIAFNLIAPRLKMIAVKDFFWEKSSKGWIQVNCPLGDGMVDWKAYFKLLRQTNFQGPVSLHLEYEINGSTASEREEKTIIAAKRDFDYLRARLREAYGET